MCCIRVLRHGYTVNDKQKIIKLLENVDIKIGKQGTEDITQKMQKVKIGIKDNKSVKWFFLINFDINKSLEIGKSTKEEIME